MASTNPEPPALGSESDVPSCASSMAWTASASASIRWPWLSTTSAMSWPRTSSRSASASDVTSKDRVLASAIRSTVKHSRPTTPTKSAGIAEPEGRSDNGPGRRNTSDDTERRLLSKAWTRPRSSGHPLPSSSSRIRSALRASTGMGATSPRSLSKAAACWLRTTNATVSSLESPT